MRSLIESPLLILQHLRGMTRQAALASGLHEHGPGAVVTKRRWAVRFIRSREVVAMLGVSRTTLWRMVREGSFPRPVRISKGNAGYLLETVEAWMRARVQGLTWEGATTRSENHRKPWSRERQPKVELVRHTDGAHG
jgi:prophage regulatory protein